MKYRKFQALINTAEGNIRECDFVVSFRFHGQNCSLISVINYLKAPITFDFEFSKTKRMSSK